MRKFWNEFHQFINRGNVMNLAVGVMVGGAFTSIVTALTKNIIQPLINWLISLIFNRGAKQPFYTVLRGVYVDGVLDTANSIFIDWGAFISAIINFFLIALLLFFLLKGLNRLGEENKNLKKAIQNSTLSREEKQEMKSLGLNVKNKKEIKKFKEQKAEKQKAQAEKEEQEKRRLEEEARKHTTEGLLEEIKALLEKAEKK